LDGFGGLTGHFVFVLCSKCWMRWGGWLWVQGAGVGFAWWGGAEGPMSLRQILHGWGCCGLLFWLAFWLDDRPVQKAGTSDMVVTCMSSLAL
jgi:hypothetical protein